MRIGPAVKAVLEEQAKPENQPENAGSLTPVGMLAWALWVRVPEEKREDALRAVFAELSRAVPADCYDLSERMSSASAFDELAALLELESVTRDRSPSSLTHDQAAALSRIDASRSGRWT